MNQALKKIGAFVLAILVWVATTSFSVSVHYCGTHIVSYSVNKQAQSCYKAKGKSQKLLITKKTCCQDKFVQKQGQNELSQDVYKGLKISKDFAVFSFYEFQQNSLAAYKSLKKESYPKYHKPPILRDRCVLFQVFRI